MNTGCPKCDEIQKESGDNTRLCVNHAIEYADSQASAWMNEVERLKQKREVENAYSRRLEG
jgi:uncharacterized C2H2 Zn-finger protein